MHEETIEDIDNLANNDCDCERCKPLTENSKIDNLLALTKKSCHKIEK